MGWCYSFLWLTSGPRFVRFAMLVCSFAALKLVLAPGSFALRAGFLEKIAPEGSAQFLRRVPCPRSLATKVESAGENTSRCTVLPSRRSLRRTDTLRAWPLQDTSGKRPRRRSIYYQCQRTGGFRRSARGPGKFGRSQGFVFPGTGSSKTLLESKDGCGSVATCG